MNDCDLISGYSRTQAFEDGVLVDVTATAREAGIKIPVALTSAAWNLCVTLSPAAERALNDESGRCWDVLWMLALSARANRDRSSFCYSLLCVTESVEPSTVTLRASVGPGDKGEPVITVMLPEES